MYLSISGRETTPSQISMERTTLSTSPPQTSGGGNQVDVRYVDRTSRSSLSRSFYSTQYEYLALPASVASYISSVATIITCMYAMAACS